LRRGICLGRHAAAGPNQKNKTDNKKGRQAASCGSLWSDKAAFGELASPNCNAAAGADKITRQAASCGSLRSDKAAFGEFTSPDSYAAAGADKNADKNADKVSVHDVLHWPVSAPAYG